MVLAHQSDTDAPARYDAFISYNRADARVARRIARRLRWYRPPKNLGFGNRRLRVFLDVDELTVAGDLPATLVERVHGSAHFVLVSSPSSARSRWVDQEVAAFLQRGRRDNLRVMLCRGELNESLPPTVRDDGIEPLFIDLRQIGGPFGWRRFRAGTLKLIAALLGVDYSALTREDAKRSRRRISSAVAAAAFAALGIGAAFIIRSEPAEVWREARLPTRHRGSPLVPVRDFAVNAEDPSLLLFKVHDAQYAAQYPTRPIGIRERDLDVFQSAAGRIAQFWGRHHRDLGVTSAPVAVLSFSIEEGIDPPRRVWGRGEMRIYAFLASNDGTLRFSRTLSIQAAPPGEQPRSLVLPPTANLQSRYPFDFEPWPADTLIAAKLVPSYGVLRGSLRTVSAAGGYVTTAVEYELVDNHDSFTEGNDGMWFDSTVVANRDSVQVEFGGQPLSLGDAASEPELWTHLTSRPPWVTYVSPTLVRLDRPPCPSQAPHLEDSARVDSILGGRGKGRELLVPLQLFDSVSLCGSDGGATLTMTSRTVAGRRMDVLSLLTEVRDDVAARVTATDRQYVIRLTDRGPWIATRLPIIESDAGAEVVDIVPLDSTGQRAVAVTKGQGIYRTLNGGSTWSDFSLGEARLARGATVRVVATGTEDGLYALVDRSSNENEGTENQLLRYGRVDYVGRLRAGLARIISGTSQ